MFVRFAQGIAAALPPYKATAAVLLAAALVALLCSLIRRLITGRGAFLRTLPAAVFIGLGAALFWPLPALNLPPMASVAAGGLAGFALLAHVVLRRHDIMEVESPPGERPAVATRLYLAAVLGIAAVLLFYNLGGYAGSVLAWESAVTTWYAQAVLAGEGVLEHTGRAFLWDNGVLSAGNTSLFFGAPTYALFWIAGFSTWTLRFFAAVATMLSIGVTYSLARRAFGEVAGVAAAAAFGLSPVVLFYGRYGSSLAGTLLAVLMALWSTWAFLDRDRSAWWMGAVCALTLYTATLQYAPARIVVLILLGMTVVVSLWEWRRLWWRRAVGLSLLGAGAIGVWELQTYFGTQYIFLLARGEQFLALIQHRDYLRSVLGREVLPESLGFLDKVDLAYRAVQVTLPQYLALLAPRLEQGEPGQIMTVDPPPLQLYYAPLILLILWGLAHSLLRLRSWRHLCLVAWVVGSTVPLLLTNRVDAHRMALFVVPLAFWAALGAWEAARALAEAHVPRFAQHGLAIALGLTLVAHDVNLLYYRQTPAPAAGEALAAEIATVSRPVVVGALWDHRQVAWVELQMMERSRRQAGWSGALLEERIWHGIADVAAPPELQVRELEQLARTSTLLLAPVERFQGVASALRQRGLQVVERGTKEYRMYRVDAPGGAGWVDSPPEPLPTIVIPPTRAPIPLRDGPSVRLTATEPQAVTFGFAPPAFDRAWGGAPLALGGVIYGFGVGVHAWTRLEYAVPAGAVAFQAIVGVADGACASASVTFEVQDAQGALLYSSGVMYADTPPRPVEVDLPGQGAIALVVTDGGDGRDCDHANWVQTSFLLATPAATVAPADEPGRPRDHGASR